MVGRLMDKVYNEEYALEYQQKLKDTYGEDVDEWVFHDSIEFEECHEIVWKFEEDKKYESLREEIRENKDKWFKESQAKQERAHKLLWKLIEFYIRGWWD